MSSHEPTKKNLNVTNALHFVVTFFKSWAFSEREKNYLRAFLAHFSGKILMLLSFMLFFDDKSGFSIHFQCLASFIYSNRQFLAFVFLTKRYRF